MGILEDFLLGIPTEEEHEERQRKYDEWMRSGFASLGEDWRSRGGDVYARSEAAAGLGGQPRDLMRDVAQGRIAERESQEGEDVIRAAVEAQRAKAAEQDDWVRSVGYEPDPMLSDPDKGILVEEMPADKIRRIRMQADAKSRLGSLSGKTDIDRFEGRFGEISPTEEMYSSELSPRLLTQATNLGPDQSQEATAAWLGGQTERDLAFAASPEQARREPQYAAQSAETLRGLKAQRDIQRRTEIQERLVDSLSGGGTIPFETAMKMEAAGMNIPWRAVGMSPKAAEAGINEIFVGAEQDLAQFANNEELMYREGARETVEYLQYILAHRDRINSMMQQGADPLKILERLKEISERQARDSGAWAFWDVNVSQQQPEAP